MPQYNTSLPAQNPSNLPTPLKVDLQGSLVTAGSTNAAYNITTPTVVKATPGKIARACVIAGGSAAGTINNCITTGAAAASNQITSIPTSPATGNVLFLDWPCSAGITVVPGTGQTIAISYI